MLPAPFRLQQMHMFFVSRATTHSDLVLRASEQKVPYKIIHNASIMNAVGCCGLQVGIKCQLFDEMNNLVCYLKIKKNCGQLLLYILK